MHGQVSQLYQERYLAGADAGAQAVKEHQAKNEKEEPKYQAGELTREAAQLKSFQARDQVHGQDQRTQTNTAKLKTLQSMEGQPQAPGGRGQGVAPRGL